MQQEQGPVRLRPTPPGRTLEAEMKARNLSASALARQLHIPANRISDIVRDRRAITADTALRLARAFGTTPAFWMNLQTSYELRRAEAEHGEEIAREVALLGA